MNIGLFHEVSQQCSRMTTEKYSTSFASAISLLHPELRQPVYNIYGFVRFADEIVDTFHEHNKSLLLENFKSETFAAVRDRISLNPILNSFQVTVNQFNISHHLVHAFFRSMEMDLRYNTHSESSYSDYIYGSAEVVGLMCLCVFCNGHKKQYDKLEPAARSLGAAFQKVNFLRDMSADYNYLSRIYFPGVDFMNFTQEMKDERETDILNDFEKAYKGIVALPWKARFGVYVAYKYYFSLFKKIRKTQAGNMLRNRIRITDYEKALILARAGVKHQLNLIGQ